MSIDPKLQKCTNCDCSWTPGTYHKIIMLITGSYTRRCPQCGTVMKFRLIHHTVKVESKPIKGKDRLWRQC